MTDMCRCDFCGAKLGRWTHPCKPFTYARHRNGDIAYFLSKGDWCACDACHRHIEREEWDMLALRRLEAFPGWKFLTPEEALEVVKKIGELHENFRRFSYGIPHVYTENY